MLGYNQKRVVHYGRNDFAFASCLDRCLDVLARSEDGEVSSINEAIECYQVKLTLEDAPEFFRERSIDDPLAAARALFSVACRYCSLALKAVGIAAVYDQVERQYSKAFWQLLGACGAWGLIRGDDLGSLLASHPECIGTILQYKGLVARFDREVKAALIASPKIAAEVIVGRLAVESTCREGLHLPGSLTGPEIDDIMLGYIGSEAANPNYLAALSKWPTGSTVAYHPSMRVRVEARRRYDKLADKMLSNGVSLQYGTGVSIAMGQGACRGLELDGRTLLYSFSGKWLGAFTDPATILNNLIYVFDFVDLDGLMRAPARQHEEDALLSKLGLHVTNEYRTPMGFQMRSGLTFLETEAYASFLEGRGASLERALEWFYNEYVEGEFGVAGFSLALPVREATWLDKCKAVGPEIERALKSYLLFAKYGEVDGAYFPFVDMGSFSGLASLNDRKYAIAGPEFERWGFALFSDQCILSYLHEDKLSEPCFFELMGKRPVTRSCYAEWLQETIDGLIDRGLISEEGDGRLSPTVRAACLRSVWERDALPLWRLGDEERALVDSMVGDSLLDYCDELFAPSEANYLDYMFNNASFSNSLGLRNWHDHASYAAKDPWARWIKDDYYKLLSLLVSITLKINEELTHKTGRGGNVDWVDWPYYDDSVFALAKELAQQ